MEFEEEKHDLSLIKEVDVICPSCCSKARYKAFEFVDTYVLSQALVEYLPVRSAE
ncbi:hypothetical protein [Sporocytophaga myxococcoides]|uniref:hypothetical protein n=1 Tax=Sporocytophaga myxococcoides TaxID=153721 RepID=UPI00042872C1|nr:hypothetical protein [Sporocytophaga myxococcoides]